jgi:DnaA family protein
VKQLILDLALPAPWTLDNFICGQNAEALHFVAAIAYGPLPDTSLYLWGSGGAGKTHILKAVTQASEQQGRPAYYLDCRQHAIPDHVSNYALLAVDNIEQASSDEQIVLFDLYNTYKEEGRNFLAAGSYPPMLLPLRQDLTTRLGWGLVYELKPLSDTDKLTALKLRAQHLGFVLSDELVHYLLHHATRDLPSLMQVLTQLDQLALTKHRHITLPLLKEALQSPLEE